MIWVHTYENHVQAFMYHVNTEKSAFIDKNLLEQFCHPLCTENDHSALYDDMFLISIFISKLLNRWSFLFYRYSFNLEKSRELEIDIYWRDWRSLCAVKFLRLEEFVDDVRHGMALQLEPQGLLFAEVCIFVGLSCAVSRSRCSKNPAPSGKPHDRPTDLSFRLTTLCTHLSGTNLSYLKVFLP